MGKTAVFVACGLLVMALVSEAARSGGAASSGSGVFGGIPGVPGGVPGNWGGVFGGPLGGVVGGGGVSRPSLTCTEAGPCYKKRLTCPRRCFKSSGKWGPKDGGSGAGGGCTMDCKQKCRAYC